MIGTDFMDEIDCGSFFDHIDDLIQFPPEDEIGLGVASANSNDFPSIWSNASEDLPVSAPIFSGTNNNSVSDLSTELAVPYEDIVQLEWLSTFVEDSFSGGGMTINNADFCVKTESANNQFRTSSPVSVLESSSSSSSCSGGKTITLSPTHRGPHRARSKRPRPSTFNPRPAMQLISPNFSCLADNPHLFRESETFADSHIIKIPRPTVIGAEHKKKKKMKISIQSGPGDTNNSPLSQAAVRKCMHCEISKTPQWRAGPMGPKTLCNACGVRYKSGRLFPEYRPAASPTFVPSVHSNSHKKVVEMRIKGGDKTVMFGPRPRPKPEPLEFVPDIKPSLVNEM